MAALTVEERRERRLKQLHENIEAQIFMCDDQDDLLLLASLMMSCSKNIFLSRFPKAYTRAVLHKYVDDVTA